MKRFLIQLFIFLLPLELVLGIYVVKDPFKVLYHYNSYFPVHGVTPIVLNKDHVSTETFLNEYDQHPYDSYIFGNSRSINYRIAEWSKHIDAKSCFHFDASDESLYGVEGKLQLLSKKKAPVKNALFVIDRSLLENVTNSDGHLFRKHPILSGENELKFQLTYLRVFLDKDFLYTYLDFLSSGHVKRYMIDDGMLNNTTIDYSIITNEISFPVFDTDIKKDPAKYYANKMKLFQRHVRTDTQTYSKPVIGYNQKIMLYNIQKILADKQTNYAIIISPLYDQIKLNPADLLMLQQIFGRGHVFDFSGINEITADYHNYYEDSHYRPVIATELMDSVYDRKVKK